MGARKRPHAELLRAFAFQRHFRDAAFDHLKTDPAVPNILRRNDGPAQVKAGCAIEVADGSGDRRKVGLGDFFPKIRLIRPYNLIARYRLGAGQRNAVKLEQRFGVSCDLRPGQTRHPQRGSVGRRLSGLQFVETLFCLSRIEARLLGSYWHRHHRGQHQHQAGGREFGRTAMRPCFRPGYRTSVVSRMTLSEHLKNH